jgi:hypothetical protein
MLVFVASVPTLPWVLFVLGGCFGSWPKMPRTTMVAGGILSITGPWATKVLQLTNALRLTDYPNAGKFFSLLPTLVLTMALAGTIAALFVGRKGFPRYVLMLLYLSLVYYWYVVAAVQLVTCALGMPAEPAE